MKSLKELRLERFISQQDLADRAHVAKSTIVGIEKGQHQPQLRTARVLAAALGVAPGDIDWPTVNGKSTGTVH